jgi:hypothetical protein
MAERRRTVLESGARKSVRRALWLLAVVTVVAGLVWLLQSPMLSVTSVDVTGSDRADVGEAIANAGLEPGIPFVLVRADKVEEELESLPWVRHASVRRVFPDRVEIQLDERVPVAWIWASGSYALLDTEGVVLEYTTDLSEDAHVLRLAVRHVEPGEAHTDVAVLGGIEFFAALDGLLAGLELREEAGELWAAIDGHEVRLGRPVDMGAKAAALVAVLEDGPPAGSSINLIAPARPAVTLREEEPSS